MEMAESRENKPVQKRRQLNRTEETSHRTTARKRKRSNAFEDSVRPTGWLGYLLLVLLTALTLAPLLLSDVLKLEYDLVQGNTIIEHPSSAEGWMANQLIHKAPLNQLSSWVDQRLPISPASAYRSFNIILHLCVAFLLIKLLEALKLPGAYMVALVFALHPSALQAIFWFDYRYEIIGTITLLAALYAGIRYTSLLGLSFALFLCAIALIAHPAAIALPLILLLVLFLQNRPLKIKHINRVLPFFCLTLFLGTWAAAKRNINASPSFDEITFISQIGQNLFFFVKESLFPLQPALFHPFSSKQGYNVGASINILPLVLFVPFYVLIVLNLGKVWARALLLGLTAFLATIIYGLFQAGIFLDGTPAQETRFLYLSLPWILSAVICGSAYALKQKSGFALFVWRSGSTALITLQILLTGSFAMSLADKEILWQKLAEDWPDSWQPLSAYIDAIYEAENPTLSSEQRIKLLDSVLTLNPDLHEQRLRLARLYRSEGQNTNAVREYKQLLRDSNPNDSFLKESASFFDSLGLTWDAQKVRSRIEI